MTNDTVDALPRIVSVDDHVVEPPNVWFDRLPEQLRGRGPHVVRRPYEQLAVDVFRPSETGPITDWWVYDDVWRSIPLVTACVGMPREELTVAPISFDAMRPGCYDSAERLADMDVNHTEASLCFPNYPRFCGQIFLEAEDKELSLLCVKAYNDWMIDEWCGESNGRLIPLCIVPLWDPELAAMEVYRNAARGCRAIAFSELPFHLGLPSIHDAGRHWDPLLRACNETKTVVCMHIGSSSTNATTSSDAPDGVVMALTFSNSQSALVDWVLSGALARFPNLKIAFSEGQVGWMPYVIERMDKVFLHSSSWANLDPAITELPSSYIPGRVYGCFFDDDIGLTLRNEIGIGQLTFETDYPHQDSTWPNTREVVLSMAKRLSDRELYQVVRGNALEMLGLDETAFTRGDEPMQVK